MLTATEREALDEAIHLPVYNPIREAIHTVVERILAEHESKGWASYAAEQERHAETMAARNAHFEARNKMAAKVEHLEARLADMTREARLSREATENAVARAKRSATEPPFWCYPCSRGEHDACKGIAWQPDVECECAHDA